MLSVHPHPDLPHREPRAQARGSSPAEGADGIDRFARSGDSHPPSDHDPDHRSGAPDPCCHGDGGRLNLLLSWAAWRPESWVDRLPPLLEPMGVQSTRALSARQAEHIIRTIPIHIAIVDLGLPLDDSPEGGAPREEAGPRVLELLRRLDSPPPTVVVRTTRTARDASREMSAALRCDAFAVVERTAANLELMLTVLQRCLDRFYHGRWPAPPDSPD